MQDLKEVLLVPLYHSALCVACILAHLQKRRIQLLRQQVPFPTIAARRLAPKRIQVAEEHTHCPCNHITAEEQQLLKKCSLHTGRDTLVNWSLADTLQQHEGRPAHSHAHQANNSLFKDPLTMYDGMEKQTEIAVLIAGRSRKNFRKLSHETHETN